MMRETRDEDQNGPRVPLKTILQNFLNHVENLEARAREGDDAYEKEFQVKPFKMPCNILFAYFWKLSNFVLIYLKDCNVILMRNCVKCKCDVSKNTLFSVSGFEIVQ